MSFRLGVDVGIRRKLDHGPLAPTARSTLLPLALAAALVTGSVSFASAQTTSPAPAANAAKPTGSLQMSHNDWRSTKLDGAYVYNEQGTSIGTIDDMLLDSDRQGVKRHPVRWRLSREWARNTSRFLSAS